MKNQDNTHFEEAERIVSRIDSGYKTWRTFSLKERIKKVQKLRKAISKNAQSIAETISTERIRPATESLSQEVIPVLEMAKYCEKNFSRWISPRKLPYRRPGFLRKKNFLFYEPIGPVAVFLPQNFPFSLGVMTLIYVLLAGNTAVLKPSEKSSLVPSLIMELLEESGLLSCGAVGVLSGGAETGKWLIQHPKIKKLYFFGRRESGEYVAEKCVKHFKPFVLELGGGTTAFVCKDADLEKAASGLAWSSFYANGQSCVATERIFVDQKIAGEFLSIFKEKATAFQTEFINKNKKGIIDASELSRFTDLIEETKNKGADVFQAGKASSARSDHFDFRYTIISNAAFTMKIFREEIFGPLVAVEAIADIETAVEEMNNNFQSLGASIWSSNRKYAMNLAKKLCTGMIWINDSSFGLPNLPWGGWGKSGWGKLFSEFSIQEVMRLKWVSWHPKKFSRRRFWWNPYSQKKEKFLLKIAEKFF